MALLISIAALAGSGVALWRALSLEEAGGKAAGENAALRSEIDGLNRRVDQSNRDRDLLRQRLADTENVNKSLREEVLGVTERARVLEDALANLAEKRLSGHDAILLDEAESLLLLARQRYELNGDPTAALKAYQLADEALSGVGDPAFATVRETLAVEQRGLSEPKGVSANARVAALETLRAKLADLPFAHTPAAEASDDGDRGRIERIFARFVRITHDADSALAVRDRGLARALIALDLREAEIAALNHDERAYAAALGRVRNALREIFLVDAAPTQAALAEIDRLAVPADASPAPDLGTTLKELRNLRSTHKLQPAAAPKPAADVQS